MGRVESSDRCEVDPAHPMLAGHFPGHPIVPGAWLLSWVIADASRRLTALGDTRPIIGVRRVKFQRPLNPAESFECELSTGSDSVRFILSSAAGVLATGTLQLQTQGNS